jgi:hypothetical protein
VILRGILLVATAVVAPESELSLEIERGVAGSGSALMKLMNLSKECIEVELSRERNGAPLGFTFSIEVKSGKVARKEIQLDASDQVKIVNRRACSEIVI